MLARIGGLQRAMEIHSTPNLRRLESELKHEYINILLQEEMLWKQELLAVGILMGTVTRPSIIHMSKEKISLKELICSN